MSPIRLLILGTIAVLSAVGQISNLSPSQNTTVRPVRRQFGPIREKTVHDGGAVDSANWGGYAVTGSSFTSATGSWIVPWVNCTGISGNEYAAFWVGIDGYTSSTVEQTGTLSDCAGTSPDYFAWVEFYPAPTYEITSVPISPGDVMWASVVYVDGKFITTIKNMSTGKSASATATVPGAARSSAEWVTEAPCCTRNGGILPLAD